MHYPLETINLLKLALSQFENSSETNQLKVSSQMSHYYPPVYSVTDF